MVVDMKENGGLMINTEKEFIIMLMEINMKVNGGIIKNGVMGKNLM
jgi:hypothetical protein